MATANTSENDPAIEDLDAEELKAELSARGLSTDGSITVMAARLICHMRDVRETRVHGDRDRLVLPRAQIARADSPTADGPGPIRERVNSAMNGFAENSPVRPRRSSVGMPHESTRNSASTSSAYNTMRKWNLHFSGETGEDAETFLLRIEEGRELIHVADDDILRCLPFFLSGLALHWFRGRRERIISWAGFKVAWRRRFGDPDYQFALRDEILRRTQGEGESVVNYFTCINALFDRLSPPWPEVEKVAYAYRNLHPRIQVLVRHNEAEDIEMLEELAEYAERRYSFGQRYRAPPTPEKSMFPDLAYRPSAESRRAQKSRTGGGIAALSVPETSKGASASPRVGKSSKKKSSTETKTQNEPLPSTAHPSRVASFKCWNCDETGHLARDCEKSRRIHCYTCGKPNVTVRTCSDCSPAGKE